MNLINPLPPLWETLFASKEALTVTTRVAINQRTARNPNCQTELLFYQKYLLSPTQFPQHRDLAKLLEEAKRENDDLIVLALWAAFERFLRQYLQAKGEVLKDYVKPAALGEQLYEHYSREVEYWSPEDILDDLKKSLFTSPEQKNRLGIAKQIYEYRNWVAHGKHPQKLPSTQLTPKPAYEILNGIVENLLAS